MEIINISFNALVISISIFVV